MKLTTKQELTDTIDVIVKEHGYSDRSAYQLTVLIRKTFDVAMSHKEVLDIIEDTGYSRKREAVMRRKLTMLQKKRKERVEG